MDRIRILVVEDDYLVSVEIVRVLKEKNYDVIGLAYNGEEGVEKCCSLIPDIVLMDLKMPKMGGLEATKKIQKLCPTPVVILTAHETTELVEQASEVGASSYLVKPLKSGEIDRAIIIALARQKDLQKLRELTKQLQEEIEIRIQSEKKLKESEDNLRSRLSQIKTLESILPICSSCKKIREPDSDPKNMDSWEQIESYISNKTTSQFSHGICPDCVKKLYPKLYEKQFGDEQ